MNAYTKIVLTILFAFVLTFGFSSVLKKGQKNYFTHKESRMKELFSEKTRYDILFIGSSRTHTTIYPKIIDSLTGLNSFNAGVEGGNLYEFKLTLDGYLVCHPPPRLVLLAIDAPSFDIDRKMFFPLQYFDQLGNPVVYSSFKEQKDYSPFIITKLPFLRIIYQDDYTKGLALQGLMKKNEVSQFGLFENKGFLSNGDSCVDTTTHQDIEKKVLQIQAKGIAYLNMIIDTCRARGIQLVFTYAPEFNGMLQKSFKNFPAFLRVAENIATANQIPFYRDDLLGMCHQQCFFANYGHVNTQGAIAYSRILGKRIADTLLQKKPLFL